MDEHAHASDPPEVPPNRMPARRLQHPILIARLLHAIAGIVYLTTAWVPVLRSDADAAGPQIIWTALGDMGTTPYPDPTAALLSAGVVAVAVAGVAAPVNRVCIVVVTVVGALVLAMLLLMIADPPSLLWDGVDDEGRPTGGMAVGRPHVGALLFSAAGLLLIAGGQCGLVARGRRRRGRSASSPPTRI